MNILSKLLRKGADKIDSVKERDKLRVWQERLEKSRSAYRGELAEMENREALYRGDRKIEANVNSGNAPVKQASYVRNIVAELIEAQAVSYTHLAAGPAATAGRSGRDYPKTCTCEAIWTRPRPACAGVRRRGRMSPGSVGKRNG